MPRASTLRVQLCDTATRVGPDAPTLCEGWDVRDLLAHLVTREGRPDTLPGVVVPALAGHTDRVRDRMAQRPFTELVRLVRQGPPRWSPTRLRPVDQAVNTLEFLVHHEDILRAQPGWQPGPADPGTERFAWRTVSRTARLRHRRAPGPVVYSSPGHGAVVAGPKDGPRTEVTGRPVDLLMWLMGRTEPTGAQVVSQA